MTEYNPGIKYVQRARLTGKEKFDMMTDLMEDDDVLEHIEARKSAEKPELVHIAETIESAKELLEDNGAIVGLRTGYFDIDQMMRGIRPGDIVVVFGDTMHGKSLFAQNVTFNIAQSGVPVLFIGTELVNDENTERFLELSGRNEEQVAGLSIFYPAEIPGYKEVDRLVKGAKVAGARLVVIDHLHMFDHDGENEAVGLSKICKEIKRVAVKYEIPVVLVSHINEDKYRSGAPHLKDLKGSSSIKQIASFALAIWARDKDPNRAEHAPDTNELTVVLRKWRRGNPKQTIATLRILPNARLSDSRGVEISAAGVRQVG